VDLLTLNDTADLLHDLCSIKKRTRACQSLFYHLASDILFVLHSQLEAAAHDLPTGLEW
jgi:hypothetical protein